MHQRFLGVVVLTGFLAGCAVQESPKSLPNTAPAPQATPAPVPASTAFYQEKEHNGRIYVFGTAQAFQASQETPQLTYTKTFIGASPDGKTVVVEADSKDVALQNRLIATFATRHGVMLK
jgi:hypothetical protein